MKAKIIKTEEKNLKKYIGKEGKITNISFETGCVEIDFGNGIWDVFKNEELELIPDPRSCSEEDIEEEEKEELNLCKILKGHEGETFYSSVHGKNMTLIDIGHTFISINETTFQSNGSWIKGGECQLFPSKDQRDWLKWDKENNHKIPKTWSELVKSNPRYIGMDYCIDLENPDGGWTRRNTLIEKSALALFKIHQLIEVGYGGNVTDEEWKKACQPSCNIFGITYNINTKSFEIRLYSSSKSIIAFHTYKQAEDFMSYLENVQLLKDYFMV